MNSVTSTTRLIVGSVVALLCGTAASYQTENMYHYQYSGRLQALTTPVKAPFEGIVEKCHHKEGDVAQPGLQLVTLAINDLLQEIKLKENTIALLKSEKDKVVAQANLELKSRVRLLEQELFETSLRSTSIEQNKYTAELQTIAWENYLKSKEAIATSVLTPDIFRNALKGELRTKEQSILAILAHGEAMNSLEVATAQANLCNEREKTLRETIKILPAEILVAYGIDLLEAKIEHAEDELNLLHEDVSSKHVKCNVHGRIGDIRKKAGDRVLPGETVAEIIDEQRRYVTAYIPSEQIPLVTVGTIVELMFPGGKSKQGVVKHIPMKVIKNQQNLRTNIPYVEIQIDPTNESVWPILPIGSEVRVQMKLKK